jgi:4'-phosphopantetheinyl transferase
MPSVLEPPTEAEIHIWRIELASSRGERSAAGAALGRILAAYLGTAAAPALVRDPAGKPRLAEGSPRLSFNLSHSGDLALVVVAPEGLEVGIDVERVKPRRDFRRLASRWLPALDVALVEGAPGDQLEVVFYAAWTRHEARVKCTGVGLAGPAPGPEVTALPLAIDDGYAAAVAIAGLDPGAAPRILLRDASCRA